MTKKFILDTNILVSSLLIKNSPPFQAIKLAEKLGIFLYSDATLLELAKVLNRKKFDKYLTFTEREYFILKFLEKAQLVEIKEVISICRDDKDNKFLELAVSGNADFIITGDNDLLVLNPFKNIKIITVSEFLNRFN